MRDGIVVDLERDRETGMTGRRDRKMVMVASKAGCIGIREPEPAPARNARRMLEPRSADKDIDIGHRPQLGPRIEKMHESGALEQEHRDVGGRESRQQAVVHSWRATVARRCRLARARKARRVSSGTEHAFSFANAATTGSTSGATPLCSASAGSAPHIAARSPSSIRSRRSAKRSARKPRSSGPRAASMARSTSYSCAVPPSENRKAFCKGRAIDLSRRRRVPKATKAFWSCPEAWS